MGRSRMRILGTLHRLSKRARLESPEEDAQLTRLGSFVAQLRSLPRKETKKEQEAERRFALGLTLELSGRCRNA